MSAMECSNHCGPLYQRDGKWWCLNNYCENSFFCQRPSKSAARTWIVEFLKAVEKALPPPDGCHHPLMYAQYGSDETGWEDRLLLQINHNGSFIPLFLDDEDLAKPISVSVAEIVQIVNNQA